ncbi:MAG: 50S ribosomal protein L11 methyltransferase [Myxococcota bacterium]
MFRSFCVVLRAEVKSAASELAQAALAQPPTWGLEVQDRSTARRPRRGHALILAYFADAAAAIEAKRRLLSLVVGARVELDHAHYDDIAAYRAQYRPMRTRTLWVGPPWAVEEAPPGLRRLVVPPQTVFGSRGHPTTRLCLQALEESEHVRGGARVLDVGCGAGVLSIGARWLGARSVLGIDLLENAAKAARQLARAHRVSRVRFATTLLAALDEVFPVVVANLPSDVHPFAAVDVLARVGGELIVAGFLEAQRSQLEALYSSLHLYTARREGPWVALTFHRRGRDS